MDILLSALGLIGLAPLLIVIGVAIRLESKGPAIFRQTRVGLNGSHFSIFKFRTMIVMEDGDQVIEARSNDPRLTRLGPFLRKTSLDELPQLLNVFLGSMSLVGPRPHASSMDAEFCKAIADYGQRYSVRPGMTGLAQVRGHRGPTRSIGALSNRVAADCSYCTSWSLLLDAKILVHTVILLLTNRSADF